jgi:hypothetical protein
MAISYEECQTIIEQFKNRHRLLMTRDDIHGVQVADEGNLVLQILTSASQDENLFPLQLRIPIEFAYRYEDQEKTIQTQTIVRDIPRAMTTLGSADAGVRAANGCEPGDEAWGDGLLGTGTAGWNFYLNNVLVCMSNWHVLCARIKREHLQHAATRKGLSRKTKPLS